MSGDSHVEDLLGLDEEAVDHKASVLRVRDDDEDDVAFDDHDVPLLNPDPHDDDDVRQGLEERSEDHCHRVIRTDGDKTAIRQLLVVSGFCTVFMFAEIIGGLLAKSLAIATDATHLACDLAGFLISLFAIWLARKAPTTKMSFGYYRAEVLGALASVLIIWAVTAVLVYLAIERIRDNDYDIQANPMMITAGIGVAFNIIMGLVLHGAGCHVHSSFGHSHGTGGHGHSHGGDHSHSHAHSGGQSHSGGGSHGHAPSDNHSHGHSHDNSSHSHSRGGGHSHAGGHSHDNSGHSHSHGGGHSHGDNSHGGCGHTHGHSSDGHSHGHSRVSDVPLPNGFIPSSDIVVDTRPSPLHHSDLVSSITSSDESVTVMPDSAEHVHMSRIRQGQSSVSRHGGVASSVVRHGIEAVSGTAHGHSHTNINVRAAMIHVIGDLIQSIGVFVAAIIIKVKPDYKIADPICTFIFSVLVLFTTINVLKDIVLIMMQGVPKDVDYKVMKADLQALCGVKMVHSLNVWSLTMDKTAVGVHLAIEGDISWQTVLNEATSLLREKYNVIHSTIQVENYNQALMSNCRMCQLP